jgi:uncharacterized protein (DUF58 family)
MSSTSQQQTDAPDKPPATGGSNESTDRQPTPTAESDSALATLRASRAQADTEVTVRRTNRWRGVVAVALLAGAVGILLQRPFLLIVAIVGVVYAALPGLAGDPEIDLTVSRRLSEQSPDHGDEVEVTVTVVNDGGLVTDLRLVDGVPPMLSVVDGTPRHTTALRSGAETTWSYTVEATHGVHRFEPMTAISRGIGGGVEGETEVACETIIECTNPVVDMPLHRKTRTHDVGPLVTDDGGSGIEFHQVREYRPGDAMNRIDWKRFARSGKLTTVEFREERPASIVMLLDAREAAYRAAGQGQTHGVAAVLAAAEQLLPALMDERVYVGVAAIGREFVWLPPQTGTEHFLEVRETLGSHPTLSMYPPEADERDGLASDQQLLELRKRLSSTDQVVLISPLADEFVVNTAATLHASGTPVTTVSPDVTGEETLGGKFGRVERRHRMATLRQAGIPVADWKPDERLGTVLLNLQEESR